MPSDRSRWDDDDDDDRPRRKPRRRRDEDDDDDDRPRRSRGGKSKTGLIVGIAVGSLLAVVIIVIAIATSRNKKPRDGDDVVNANDPHPTNPFNGNSGRNNSGVDDEGLPVGYELDSILVRLNHRYRQNDFFRYQIETENLRFIQKDVTARSGEVFRTFRSHAGTLTAAPQIGTIPFVAWQQMLMWVTKDDVPELCKMLVAERLESRQSDLLGKIEKYKDPRCAETIAPFLTSARWRGRAETLLKELDSTVEKFVLPYLGANYDKDIRIAALQIVVAVGTIECAKLVEPMTRDADLSVNQQAKIAFGKLCKKFGIEQDLLAVVKALKDGIIAQRPFAIYDALDQLDKGYRDDHPQRAEIFKALIECCKVNDPKNNGRLAAFKPALKWSSKDDIETLCHLLVFSGGESVVFLKLKEYMDPKCAQTVAAFLAAPLKMGEAAAVLKALGAPAEKAVLPYSFPQAPNGAAIPFGTRLNAIDVLGEIGTSESVPYLQQLTMDLTVQAAAKKALDKIAARDR